MFLKSVKNKYLERCLIVPKVEVHARFWLPIVYKEKSRDIEILFTIEK